MIEQGFEMVRVRQSVLSKPLEKPLEVLNKLLDAKWIKDRLRGKNKIGIAVGSRGIRGLVGMVDVLLHFLINQNKQVYIIPAMGSHGGGAAEGQRVILERLGISEKAFGVPIIPSMDVADLGMTPEGIPCFFSTAALDLDGIFLLNRIKPHTTMEGETQSGLMKMAVVGLGKERGASTAHRFGLDNSITAIWKNLAGRLPIIAGIGTVEDGDHEIAVIEVIPSENIFTREKELFKQAKAFLSMIPFDEADLLIVEKIGKDISGPGMDTNVIGKWRRLGGERKPYYHRILVLGLTSKTGGNAIGIGLADFTTEDVMLKIDRQSTYLNAMTADFPEAAKIPLYTKTEHEALGLAMSGLDEKNIKILQIKNTLDLREFGVSNHLWKTTLHPEGLIEVGRYSLDWDEKGHLNRLES